LRASRVAVTQIGHTGGLIGPGMGNYTWLWVPIVKPSKHFPRSRFGQLDRDQTETHTLESWSGIGHVAVDMAIIDEGEANGHRRQ
jgi:hypothetical protein